jgi:uracil-DNA glycosylase
MGSGADARNFLQQQVELYGDELALEKADLVFSRGEPAVAPRANIIPSSRIADAEETPRRVQESTHPEIDLQAASLDELQQRISGCQHCSIGYQRKNLVFGTGNPAADIVLIGEAPGFHEDEQGEPFVGEAGQLLTKILAAIKLERSDVYICNLLKCRPSNNRDPLPGEVQNCLPYLEKQLDLIKPAFILCLGRFAAQTLLKTQAPLSQMRGTVHSWRGSRLIVTYHPAALLRYPKFKTETWQDVQMLRRSYDEFLAAKLPR